MKHLNLFSKAMETSCQKVVQVTRTIKEKTRKTLNSMAYYVVKQANTMKETTQSIAKQTARTLNKNIALTEALVWERATQCQGMWQNFKTRHEILTGYELVRSEQDPSMAYLKLKLNEGKTFSHLETALAKITVVKEAQVAVEEVETVVEDNQTSLWLSFRFAIHQWKLKTIHGLKKGFVFIKQALVLGLTQTKRVTEQFKQFLQQLKGNVVLVIQSVRSLNKKTTMTPSSLITSLKVRPSNLHPHCFYLKMELVDEESMEEVIQMLSQLSVQEPKMGRFTQLNHQCGLMTSRLIRLLTATHQVMTAPFVKGWSFFVTMSRQTKQQWVNKKNQRKLAKCLTFIPCELEENAFFVKVMMQEGYAVNQFAKKLSKLSVDIELDHSNLMSEFNQSAQSLIEETTEKKVVIPDCFSEQVYLEA